jgi:hypothetical protein
MPGSDVLWPVPLTRFPTLFPPQFGVPGTDSERGLRMHSTGTIFYVDPNAIGVSDGRDGTNPDEPLATVAAALTHCQPYRGDVIAVMANNAWQYGRVADGYRLPISEEVVVSVPGVRIVGVCPSGSNGVVWMPASNGGTCITVNAIDTLIEGFFFTEGAFTGCDAIAADWNGTTTWGDNLTVRHCTFDDTVDTAISMEFVWYAHIHDNVFWRCDVYGVYVDPLGSGVSYCVIHDNIFMDVATSALSLPGADYCKIHHNNIYNTAAQAGGAATDAGITTEGGGHNIVDHNALSCLLPVPAAGDYGDFCTPDIATPPGGSTDAWISNYCLNGPTVTNPT